MSQLQKTAILLGYGAVAILLGTSVFMACTAQPDDPMVIKPGETLEIRMHIDMGPVNDFEELISCQAGMNNMPCRYEHIDGFDVVMAKDLPWFEENRPDWKFFGNSTNEYYRIEYPPDYEMAPRSTMREAQKDDALLPTD